MRRAPTPRSRVYDIYWYFAAERYRILQRRFAGQPAPWTTDRILREFKFCNVFRATDRVSQFLIRDVAYHAHPCTPEDRVFQIVAFRTFSKVVTWRTLVDLLGHPPTLADLSRGLFRRALDRTRELNGGLYTGAFILCATKAYGESTKHGNHVRLFEHMFLRDKLATHLLHASSLREIYSRLHGYPLVGDFMAYQFAVDINYSQFFHHSENDFTRPGPGALRGMGKVFESLGDYTPDEIIHWMVARQESEFQRLGLPFGGLWGRPLHAIDCQGLFCETDKYCREAVPALVTRRKRIKQRFVPSREPLDFFFPPKWGISVKRSRRASSDTARPKLCGGGKATSQMALPGIRT